MSFTIKKATRTQARSRLALIGPSGAGKTFTALAIATFLKKPIAVIDTERGSASKYADLEFMPGVRFEFDVVDDLDAFSPEDYVKVIAELCKREYGTIIIDSLSHAWMGKGGALEQVDKAAKRSQSANTFAAWRDVTPMHNRLVDTIISAPAHIIATMRTKVDWVIEEDSRGKKVPKKIGLAPVQRDGLDYEFDVVADMTLENEMIIGKTRCPALAQKTFSKPGKDVADILNEWLSTGVAMPEPEKAVEVLAPVSPFASKVAELAAKIAEAKAAGTPAAREEVIALVRASDLPKEAMAEVRQAYAAAFPPALASAPIPSAQQVAS